MVHMQRMCDEAAMIEGNLDTLGAGRDVEGDGEGAAVCFEREGAQKHVLGALESVVAGEIGRGVDLDAELGDVVFRGRAAGDGGEERLLDGVGAGDHEGAVKEEESNGVVEAGDLRAGSRGEALTEGFGRIVDQHFQGRVRG